jgi:hypothetical protein
MATSGRLATLSVAIAVDGVDTYALRLRVPVVRTYPRAEPRNCLEVKV